MSQFMQGAVPQDPANYIRFPPFPATPDGVHVVPFREFKECGILPFNADEEVELDGRGIPTVELRVKHATDVCKTNAKRKRKKGTKLAPQGPHITTPGAPKKDWWQIWEEGEDLRVYHYDPHLSRIDRLFSAAADFRTRHWPPNSTGIQSLWDQFRLFIGLLSPTPNWGKSRATEKAREAEGNMSDDDSVSSHDDIVMDEPDQAESIPRAPAKPASVSNGKHAEKDGAVHDDQGDDKINAFLNDPETTIKIFLSSHMIKQGLIWSDRNLVILPRLMSFFINFLLRNRALPEATHERGLRRALVVVDLALKELPLTSKIPKVMPDSFHLACRGCWDPKAEGYKTLQISPFDTEDEVTEERDAKRQKVDGNSDGAQVRHSEASKADDFEAELRAANIEVIQPGAGITLTKEIVEDNLDEVGWASEVQGGAWGGDTWGGANNDPIDSFGTTDDSAWAPVVYSLFPFLGPTSLPITHTTGVVEMSVRRIKSFAPPSTATAAAAAAGQNGPDAYAVDAVLETEFAKVVLEPWLGWDATDDGNLAKPRILESSRGPVVNSDGTIATDDSGSGEKPHDPTKDEITVLVEPSVLASLSVGIGVGGTWVQMAHKRGGDDEANIGPGTAGEESGKKKKKGKGKKSRERYWYIDELTMTLPSYYTTPVVA